MHHRTILSINYQKSIFYDIISIVNDESLMPSYFDNMASTPLDPRVLDAMLPYFLQPNLACNHAAQHRAGENCRQAIDQARETILASLGGQNNYELIFTSGATESINLCLSGLAHAYRKQKNHVRYSKIEIHLGLVSQDGREKKNMKISN